MEQESNAIAWNNSWSSMSSLDTATAKWLASPASCKVTYPDVAVSGGLDASGGK